MKTHRRRPWRRGLAALSAAACCDAAFAHAFAAPYALPVPFWMYAYGACTALVVSFLMAGVMTRNHAATLAAPARRRGTAVPAWPLPEVLARGTKALSLTLLLACMASGWAGSQNPFVNMNMTLFWIVFALGFTYFTALAGDVFAWANPWRVLCGLLARCGASFSGRRAYPARWGAYPALLLYFGFIWIELFGHTTPASLSHLLAGYTILTVCCAWLFGVESWMRHGEFFSVFFRLIGLMAPVAHAVQADGRVRLHLRAPLSGLLAVREVDAGQVLFILFMLASTAFDGAHETQPWSQIFWGGVYPLIQPGVEAASAAPHATAAWLYRHWQWVMLAASPFVYFGLYAMSMQLSRLCTRSNVRAADLRASFALSLLPIAFVYHLTHYYTVFIAQASQLGALLADPFGLGWSLWPLSEAMKTPVLLESSLIWHSQVALILGGHVASVFLAQEVAQHVFATSAKAFVSQVPMLLLMVGFTAAGLWILSLPLAGG